MLSNKTRYKILWMIIIFNMLPFLMLFFNIVAIRVMIDIIDSIAFPIYSYVYTESPKYQNLWYHIFQFNYFIFITYFTFVILSFYLLIVRKDNRYLKLSLIIISEIILIFILSFNEQYILPLIILYNFSIFLLLLFHQLDNNKPIRWFIIILIFINIIGIITNYLFRQYSLGNNEFLSQVERSLYDLNYIQSSSKLLLYDSLTSIYYTILIYTFIYLLYKLIQKVITILKKNKHKIQFFNKLEIKVFIFFFSLLFIIQVLFSSYRQFYYSLSARNVEPIQGCYKTHMNLGLGEDYLDDNYYFHRCFNTSQGVYTVYKEVEKEKTHYFNLIEQVTFKRIILFDEKGNEILSFDISDKDVDIYVTTEEEVKQGYNNLISVVQKIHNEDELFPDYYIYDLSGELILKLPYGYPHRYSVKTDLLVSDGLKLLFKDNKIIYKTITDDNSGYLYNIYLDGTIELLDN